MKFVEMLDQQREEGYVTAIQKVIHRMAAAGDSVEHIMASTDSTEEFVLATLAETTISE